MSESRRWGIYLAALLGLLLSLAAVAALAWQLADVALLGGTSEENGGGVESGQGLPLVPILAAVAGLVVWIAAWTTANRAARPLTMAGAAERASESRKIFLYIGQLAALLLIAILAWRAGRAAVLLLLGGGAGVLTARWTDLLPLLAGATGLLVVWAYLRWEAARDQDAGTERTKAAARWRRAYIYLAVLAGTVLTFFGAAELLRVGLSLALRPLAGDTAWHVPAADALAALLVGVPLGSLAWGRANRALETAPIPEANALSRVLVRYGVLFVSSVMTLISLGYLANQAILRGVNRTGAAPQQAALFGLFDWTWALAYLPVAAITWISYAARYPI